MRAAALGVTGVLTLLLVELLTSLVPVVATWVIAALSVVLKFGAVLFFLSFKIALVLLVVGMGILVFSLVRRRMARD